MAAQPPGGHWNGAPVRVGSPRRSNEGERRLAKLMAASVKCEEAESGPMAG
jgi:hypothetical protein